MYQIGDAVVYPPYGAGYVRDIVKEENTKYYTIELLLMQMKISVPSSSNKFRLANSEAELKKAFSSTKNIKIANNLPSNKKRMEAYEQILIEGDLESVISIWNILFEKKNQNGLNQLERDVYQKVEEMLVSEIMIASNLTLDRAKDWLRMYAINS